jgi:hypothetical protein
MDSEMVMEQSPSWEAHSSLYNSEILHLLWNLKVNYIIHRKQPLYFILNQKNLVHIPTHFFFKAHFNSIIVKYGP